MNIKIFYRITSFRGISFKNRFPARKFFLIHRYYLGFTFPRPPRPGLFRALYQSPTVLLFNKKHLTRSRRLYIIFPRKLFCYSVTFLASFVVVASQCKLECQGLEIILRRVLLISIIIIFIIIHNRPFSIVVPFRFIVLCILITFCSTAI